MAPLPQAQPTETIFRKQLHLNKINLYCTIFHLRMDYFWPKNSYYKMLWSPIVYIILVFKFSQMQVILLILFSLFTKLISIVFYLPNNSYVRIMSYKMCYSFHYLVFSSLSYFLYPTILLNLKIVLSLTSFLITFPYFFINP